MRRRRLVWVVPIAIVLVAAAVAVPMALRGDAGPPDHQAWIATLATIRSIDEQNGNVAAQYFDRATSFVLGGDWRSAAPGQAWASAAQFAADLAAGTIPEPVRAVMYDPEGWGHTPETEQRDPIAAIEAFSTAARAAGYQVIATPHPNLVEVPHADCEARDDESVQEAFLRCDIAGSAARVADVVEIQAQWLEPEPAVYADFVRRATDQARMANPDVTVIAGLSTRFAPTPQTLVDAWNAVRAVVDGHYMAVPEGIHPEIAAAFLEQIAAT
jgi:hypothetical protein